MKKIPAEILNILPSHLSEYVSEQTEEIRFRRNCPVFFMEPNQEIVAPFWVGSRQTTSSILS